MSQAGPGLRAVASILPVVLAGAAFAVPALLAWVGASSGDEEAPAQPPVPPVRVGGCHTTEREYGLPALADSAIQAAVSELLAPGTGPKTGPACARLRVDTPLFAQVGAVAPLADEDWVRAVRLLCARLDSAGIHIAERSLLRHTVGPCFPPYHVDLRACGVETQVAAFLDSLGAGAWAPFAVASERGERRLFVAAGRNLSLMNSVVDLR